jgi:AcrR family transcriptional regulator
MNHIVTLEDTNQPSYAERRAAMADETRTRILDACVAILARGVAELSIPAVAREAHVSVPTVYRNFADKKTLVRETAHYLRDKRGPVPGPMSFDNMAEQLKAQFLRSASVAENVRAALTSEPVMAARREEGEAERRTGYATKLLDEHIRHLSPRDRQRAILVTTVLCSSSTMRAFRDHTGTEPEDAAEAVAWAIGRLVGRDLPKSTSAPKKSKGTKR